MISRAITSALGDPHDAQEKQLWCAFSAGQSPEVREKLFAIHAGFARSVGRRVCQKRNYGDIDPADVEQAAFVGLMQAIDRFDPHHGTPFRGFAAARISGAVIEAIAKMSEMREQISWRHRIRSERLRSLHPRDVQAVSTEEALEALAEIAVGLAIGFMLEGTTLYQDQHSIASSNAYESAIWKEMTTELRACIDQLPERERSILSCHYFNGVAFDQIAELFGVSKGRISQLHRAALDRLRKAMGRFGHLRFEERQI